LYIRSSNVYKEIETLENNKKEKYTQVWMENALCHSLTV
jgi:hypothetical protein